MILVTNSQTVIAGFEVCACAIDVTSSIGLAYSGFTINPMTSVHAAGSSFNLFGETFRTGAVLPLGL